MRPRPSRLRIWPRNRPEFKSGMNVDSLVQKKLGASSHRGPLLSLIQACGVVRHQTIETRYVATKICLRLIVIEGFPREEILPSFKGSGQIVLGSCKIAPAGSERIQPDKGGRGNDSDRHSSLPGFMRLRAARSETIRQSKSNVQIEWMNSSFCAFTFAVLLLRPLILDSNGCWYSVIASAVLCHVMLPESSLS
jgi:hypothetical protein